MTVGGGSELQIIQLRMLTLFSENQQYIRSIRGMEFHNICVSSGLGPWQEGVVWA
jgi:hypothetical protein